VAGLLATTGPGRPRSPWPGRPARCRASPQAGSAVLPGRSGRT